MTRIIIVNIDGLLTMVPDGAIGYLHRLGSEPGRWVYSEAEVEREAGEHPWRFLRVASDPEQVRRDENDRPLSGWCTECGEYMWRESANVALIDSTGETHRHPNPWTLGEKPPARLAVNTEPLRIVKAVRCSGCGNLIGGLRVHADGCPNLIV